MMVNIACRCLAMLAFLYVVLSIEMATAQVIPANWQDIPTVALPNVDLTVSDACFHASKQYAASNTSLPHVNEMQLYSGHYMNDPGSSSNCDTLHDAHFCMSSYTLFVGYAVESNTGMCVPKVCNSSDMMDTKTFKNLVAAPYNSITNYILVPGSISIYCMDEQEPSYETPEGMFMLAVTAAVTLVVIVASMITVCQDDMLGSHHDKLRQMGVFGSMNVNMLQDSGGPDSPDQNYLPLDLDYDNEESTQKEANRNISLNIWKCFSIPHNIKSLSVSPPGPDKAFLKIDTAPLNGIRVLSILWVILGHTFSLVIGLIFNSAYTFTDVVPSFTFQAINQATYSVDTFFYLSGFLGSYFLLKMARKNNKLPNYFLYVLRRYLRLTPSYAFCILWLMYVTGQIFNGPLWGFMPDMSGPCKDYWWTNLLYINNFHPADFDSECMGWGWYLANDMQMALLLPLIVWLYLRKPAYGYMAVFLLCVSCDFIRGYLAHENGVMVAGFQMTEQQLNQLYSKPYTRWSPYFLGALTVFLLESAPKMLSKARWRFYVACLVAGASFFWVVYTPYCISSFQGEYTTAHWSRFHHELFLSLNRCVYGVALSILVFCLCSQHEDYLTFTLGKVLGANFWNPLAKLTYGCYLTHVGWVIMYSFSREQLLVYSNIEYVYLFIGHVFMGYSLSFILYLLIEAPCNNLLKIILK